jgi:CBS domain-containing protein
MRAREIMTRPVITLEAEMSLLQAAAVLAEQQVAAAPVLNEDGELVGMLTEGDLITERLGPDPGPQDRRGGAAQTVGEVMTSTVIAMSASADAADLAEAMLDYDVHSVPIVEGSEVIGIVSQRDLLRTLLRSDNVIRAEVASRLDAYTGGLRHWRVEVADGGVDLFGEVADETEAQALRALAGTVPGVGSVRLHAPSAASSS